MDGIGRLAYLTFDAVEPRRLAEFYGGLLGLPVRWEGGPYVVLAPPAPLATSMIFQRVSDPASGKNRAHADIHVPDLEAATTRAEQLGATRVTDVEEFDLHWRVLRDPEGNVFCLVHHPEESPG